MTRPILSTFPDEADPFQELPASHSGLSFAYGPGRVRDHDGTVTDVAASTLTLTDSTTNYIEVTGAGVVSKSTSGFTPGRIALYTAVCASGEIGAVTDFRATLAPPPDVQFLARAAGFGAMNASGVYWSPAIYGAAAQSSTAAGDMRLVPIVIPAPVTVDRIGIEVTSAVAASVCRLGIYSSTDGLPDALTLDAGTVDASTTGGKEIVISQALTPGIWWLAHVSQGGNPTIRGFSGANNPLIPVTSLTSTIWTAFLRSGVTGALPDPAGVSSTSSFAPLVRVRFA